MRRIDVRPGFALFVLALAYFDTAGLFFPYFSAAALHEGGHLLALWGLAFLFVYCTFHPPELGLWQDPVTLGYGLPK